NQRSGAAGFNFSAPILLRKGDSGGVDRRPNGFDQVEIEVTPPGWTGAVPVPLLPSQLVYDAFAYQYPGGHAPILIGVTDLPIVRDAPDNPTPDRAQELSVPCEVSGQLTGGDERDWYALHARKGEVIWLEGLGTRIGSPIDLDIVVFDAEQNELLRLADCLE